MIQLAVPVGRIMDCEPLTVEPDDVLEEVTPELLDVEYRTAVVVDARRRPARPRGPLRAGRARAAQGDPRRPRGGGPERAGHRAGGDRRDPRPPPHRLDRDPRFRCGRRSTRWARPRRWSPSGSPRRVSSRAGGRDDAAGGAALGHRGAHLPDDHRPGPARRRAPRELLDVDPERSAGRCSRRRRTSPTCPRRRSSPATPSPTSSRATAPRSSPRSRWSATDLLSRADELREALEAARSEGGHALAALMVTDIVARATDAARGGRRRRGGARVRRAGGRGRGDPPPRRDEPQEAGRSEDLAA